MTEHAKSATNFNIQALRAVAAYAVVGHHIISLLRYYVAIGRFGASPSIGATGVNLFFVISGYIMMATTARRSTNPWTFITHRLIRVVPLYWLLSILAVAITAVGFSLFGHTELGVNRIARSLLFLPEFGASHDVVMPILFVGWTLNYEMMFYALFAVCLLLRRAEIRMTVCCIAIAGVWAAHLSIHNAYLQYWGDDIILAFALGMMLWKLNGITPLSIPAASLWLVVGCAAMTLPDVLPGLGAARHVIIVPDIGAALIVYGALSLERLGYSVGDGWLKRQGDISYSLYLLHPFVLQCLGKIWLKVHWNDAIGGVVAIVPVLVVASGVLATGMHHIVERPLTDWLRRQVDPKDAPLPVVP